MSSVRLGAPLPLSLPRFDRDDEPLRHFAVGRECRLADVERADLGRYHFDWLIPVVDLLVTDSTLGLALKNECGGDGRAGLISLRDVLLRACTYCRGFQRSSNLLSSGSW
jgi:hypothetical protein